MKKTIKKKQIEIKDYDNSDTASFIGERRLKFADLGLKLAKQKSETTKQRGKSKRKS